MAKTRRRIHLSDLQFAVMRALWANGEAATAAVAAELRAGRGLAHTTVATLLTRLEKRGVVAQRREGRTLVYRALVTESEVRHSMVADLVSTLFKGDPAELVAHLVREDEVTPADLAKVRALIKEAGRD
jgi:BlaI family penicillinase repressor